MSQAEMQRRNIQVPPFSVRLLQGTLDPLLPASYRTKDDDSLTHLHIPEPDYVAFLKEELDLQKISCVFRWLWVAGRPMPPRPLHHQLILGREILITERMDMHLVWTTGQIFLKPIPPFLLEPSFWEDHLSCREGCHCPQDPDTSCKIELRARALGILSSYTALVSHMSDFLIAQDRHLIPRGVEWPAWRTLVREVVGINDIDQKVDQRFIYGELRLDRLNWINLLSGRIRGYMLRWNKYTAFFRDNLSLLASGTVYIAVVLTAMQVGLATSLADNSAFLSASYGFTIFSILGPLVVAALMFLVFLFIFIDNWVETVRYRRKRFHAVEGGLEE
ncbi:hypothetical protein VPNG_05680 [Cytospora leucostoma]|uniref:Uncharacterized protein n=1 Tax=Cytospora leucostoma TaxID=1230097 RepID=A0A423X083_9PEZI|nr:hypothetical protein VPNG_05680 [Cytospora leucostoma]